MCMAHVHGALYPGYNFQFFEIHIVHFSILRNSEILFLLIQRAAPDQHFKSVPREDIQLKRRTGTAPQGSQGDRNIRRLGRTQFVIE